MSWPAFGAAGATFCIQGCSFDIRAAERFMLKRCRLLWKRKNKTPFSRMEELIWQEMGKT